MPDTVGYVRIAAVTESFLPQVNGVTTSVLRVVEHARARGHGVLVVAPAAGRGFAHSYGLRHGAELLWRRTGSTHSRASVTLAPSTAAIAALQARGVPRVRRWGRGVDLDTFHPRHRTRGTDDPVRVGYIGRLAREKRIGLLSAIADVPGTELLVVGDGPDRRRLERALPTATFTGQLSGLALSRAYANLDVFVHAGPDETFCQAAQEAKSSGVPIVRIASGGLIDLIEHGTTGLLWRDGVQLRACVELLVRRPALRRRLGEAARRSVLDRSWTVVGDQLLDHYVAAVGRRVSEEVTV